MRQICCECKIQYGVKEPLADDSETHGYCPDCYDLIVEDLVKKIELKKDESPS